MLSAFIDNVQDLYKTLTIALPAGKHVGNRAPVFARDELLDLFTREPLELAVAKGVGLEIGLASHDTRLHEEDSLANLLATLLGVGDGILEVSGVVADGCISDNPSVHVDAARLHDDAFGSLV